MRWPFVKLVAAGNDFVLLDTDVCGTPEDISALGRWVCRPHTGIGADGLILLARLAPDRLRVTVVNPDGSVAKMCGNGIRCAAYHAFATGTAGPVDIEFGPHRLRAWPRGDLIEVTSPLRAGVAGPISLAGLDFHTVDTGTEYAVAVVPDAAVIDMNELGAFIRYHPEFAPGGVSVSVLQVVADGLVVRTYERGNEEETLACGSGAVACALVARSLDLVADGVIAAHTRGGEPLRVRVGGAALTLTGPATTVFDGAVEWAPVRAGAAVPAPAR